MTNKTQSISITITPALLNQIDAKRADVTRSKFICRVLEMQLNDDSPYIKNQKIKKFLANTKVVL